MQKNTAHILCFCGLMIALAVLFQSAPVFLPAAGLAISPLASLPVALAAVRSKPYGLLSWLASACILLIIFPQESAIFLCSTGLLGLFLGMYYRKKMYISVLLASLALFSGMILLTRVFHIDVFGDLTPKSSLIISLPVFLVFSVVYATAWAWIVKFAVMFLIKIKLLDGSIKK